VGDEVRVGRPDRHAGLEIQNLYGWFDRRPFDDDRSSSSTSLASLSEYDPIARLYDPWSASVVEDISFYVDEALAAGGPVVELGVGHRAAIAIPTAMAGVDVIGVDSSAEMLAVCRQRADEPASAGARLRLGDAAGNRRGRGGGARYVSVPRYLHLRDDTERLEALAAAHALLRPGGRLVFDVFTPSRDDIEETHGRWIERERASTSAPTGSRGADADALGARPGGESTMTLWWLEPARWHTLLGEAGFDVLAANGWFDRRRSPGRGQRLDRPSK